MEIEIYITTSDVQRIHELFDSQINVHEYTKDIKKEMYLSNGFLLKRAYIKEYNYTMDNDVYCTITCDDYYKLDTEPKWILYKKREEDINKLLND